MNHAIDTNSSDHFNALIEPFFYYGLRNSSNIADCLVTHRVLNYLEYSLKQNPNDLSCHLQRIQISISRQNRDELFAALCDLFIILGTKGQPLRQRMLAYGKRKLTKKQIELLVNHLTKNSLSSDLSSLPDNSFFKKRTVALLELYRDSKVSAQELENVLHTADSYIEHTQFDTAVEYMNQHLKQDPENEELTIKLISLYKALNDATAFKTAYNKFAIHLVTSRYWDDAKHYFLNH